MARTVRPARTARTQLVTKAKSHDVAFTDHAGRQARMAWTAGLDEPSLPPLSGFAIYFVHPEFPSPPEEEIFDAIACLEDILHDADFYQAHWRLDFYFLPGAGVAECVEHYHRETDARGDISDQVDKVRRARGGDQDAWPEGKLPGLVSAYERCTSQGATHQGMLFIYEDKIWDATTGAAEEEGGTMLLRVKFYPVLPIEQCFYEEEVVYNPDCYPKTLDTA